MGQDGGIGLPTLVSALADQNAEAGVWVQPCTPKPSARTGSDGVADAARPMIADTTTVSLWTTPHAARTQYVDGEH